MALYIFSGLTYRHSRTSAEKNFIFLLYVLLLKFDAQTFQFFEVNPYLFLLKHLSHSISYVLVCLCKNSLRLLVSQTFCSFWFWRYIHNNYQLLFSVTRMGFLKVAIFTTISAFLGAFSPNYMILVILWMLVGVGASGGQVYSTWFLELVPAHMRGTWMVIYWTFWTLGTILEAVLAWVCP